MKRQSAGTSEKQSPRRVFLNASMVAAISLASAATAHSQDILWWAGEIQSRGAKFSDFCTVDECYQSVGRTPRYISGLEIGLQQSRWVSEYAALSIGASISRRGWAGGVELDEIFFSVPVLGMIEPWGRDARLGITVAGGASLDVSLSHARNRWPSVVAGSWLYARLSPGLRVVAGVRGSRAMWEHPGDRKILRSRTIFLGFESR